jgi:predicted anti-sigma-YlaC factor YlaD
MSERVLAMNCKETQDLILTDYIDDQMGDKPKDLVHQHLAHCQACNNFLINIKNELITPLNNANRAVPDELLWFHIKQNIKDEQQLQLEKDLKPGFWENLRNSVHIPRPAFALATLVTMIFMIGTTGQLFMNSQVVQFDGPQQMQYLSSLVDEPLDTDVNNGNDQQTPIEKYFL